MKTIIFTDNTQKAERLKIFLYREGLWSTIVQCTPFVSLESLNKCNFSADVLLVYFDNEELYKSFLPGEKCAFEVVLLLPKLLDFVCDSRLMKHVNSVYVFPLDYRILALDLRRILFQTVQNQDRNEIAYEKFTLNHANRQIRYDTRVLVFKNKEYALMKYFIENSARVIPRVQIMESVWDFNEEVNTNTLEVHISNLRKLLKKAGVEKNYIKTIPCVGYQFVA